MKQILNTLYAGTFGLLILSACQTKEVIKENDMKFTTIKIEKKVHLFNDTAKPACDFKMEMEYPLSYPNKELLAKVQKQFIESYLGEQYISMTPEMAADQYTQNYIKSYLTLEKDYEQFVQIDKNNNEAMWMNYQQWSDSKILFNMGDFLSYSVFIYSYTGGAHGLGTTIYHVLNLKTGDPVILSDIFADGSLNDISSLIKQTLAKEAGYDSPAKLEEIGYNMGAIVPTENFFINEKGITWRYNPYDIAAYAMGSPTAFIEYEQLLPYILENSPILKLAKNQN